MKRQAQAWWAGLAGAAVVLGGWLGTADAAEGTNPVQAQALRKARLDAEALAAIRERTRALVEALQLEPVAAERSLEGTVQALRGDTLYLRTGPAQDPLIVPLKLQPSTRVFGRPPPLRRPGTRALRLQLEEGEPVRARFTVSTDAQGAQNLATSVQAAPAPAPPSPPPAQR